MLGKCHEKRGLLQTPVSRDLPAAALLCPPTAAFALLVCFEEKKQAVFLGVTLDLSRHEERGREGSGGSQSCSAAAVSITPFGCRLSSNATGAVPVGPGTSATAIKPLVETGLLFLLHIQFGV